MNFIEAQKIFLLPSGNSIRYVCFSFVNFECFLVLHSLLQCVNMVELFNNGSTDIKFNKFTPCQISYSRRCWRTFLSLITRNVVVVKEILKIFL